eukprot:TRINITY_DN7518_c0_g2_i1.p2 TRINITY_DN7518_c0_g2~~TRINITY_DN7518_c0_g2_i1.p2  ORF type:complete len:112 (+),score=0.06 TRINITY_DN7518_c0_g2_i1:1-336(+)
MWFGCKNVCFSVFFFFFFFTVLSLHQQVHQRMGHLYCNQTTHRSFIGTAYAALDAGPDNADKSSCKIRGQIRQRAAKLLMKHDLATRHQVCPVKVLTHPTSTETWLLATPP